MYDLPTVPAARAQVFSVVSASEVGAKHPAVWKPTLYTIMRDSHEPVYSEVNSHCPEPGAVSSLGFNKDIVIDTVVPFVERVYFAETIRADGDEARRWSPLRRSESQPWTWQFPAVTPGGDETTARLQPMGVSRSPPQKQILDVRSTRGPFSSGSYRLKYGAHMHTLPIRFDASALELETALKGMLAATDLSIWDVSVLAKDDAPWLDGWTYVVEFTRPQFGLKLLEVDTVRCVEEGTCDPWKCQADLVACEPTIVVNADAQNVVLQAGVLDVVVRFSAPVLVSGTPTLALNSGGIARFVRGGTRQVLDVNVGAAREEFGRFKLQYGTTGGTTGCIDGRGGDTADAVSAFSLKSRLLEIDAIKVLGLRSVEGVPLRNGYRVTVVFDRGDPAQLLPADAASCADAAQGITAFQPGTHVTVPDTAELHFRYFIGAADAAEYLAVDSNNGLGRNIVLADAVADTIVRSTNNNHNAALTPQPASLVLPSYIHLRTTEGETSSTSLPSPPPSPSPSPLPSPPLLPLLPTHLIRIDTATQPTVLDVFSTLASGTYYPGDVIPVVVKFDHPVWVGPSSSSSFGGSGSSSQQPVLWLRAGQYVLGGGSAATYAGGSGTTELSFSYRAGAADDALSLDIHSVYALDRNGVEITALVVSNGNNGNSVVYADLSLPAPDGALSHDGGAIQLSVAQPAVVSVTSESVPDPGAQYHPGEVVRLKVQMDKAVAVRGNPRLYLNTVAGSSAPWTRFAAFGRRQVLDVGVLADQPVTSGQFRVSYDDELGRSTFRVTGCIDWNDAIGLKARLLEVPEIADVGIDSVTGAAEGNGWRFVVDFHSGEPFRLRYSYETEAARLCLPFLPPLSGAKGQTLSELITTPPLDLANEVWFTYTVQEGDGIDALVPGDANALWVPAGGYVRQRSANPLTDADLSLSTQGTLTLNPHP
jgi:hypothetical protein